MTPMINANTLSSHSLTSLPTSSLRTPELHSTLPRMPGDVPKQLKTLLWVESISSDRQCAHSPSQDMVRDGVVLIWKTGKRVPKKWGVLRKGRKQPPPHPHSCFEEGLAESRLRLKQENTVHLLPIPQETEALC